MLFTFALGTAAGDLLAEKIAIGYWKSALIFGGAIAVIYLLHRALGLNAILAFWLGIHPHAAVRRLDRRRAVAAAADGGLGLGTTVTSVIFLTAIAATVAYLTVTKRDRIEGPQPLSLDPPRFSAVSSGVEGRMTS